MIREAVRELREAGYNLCRIEAGTKTPYGKAWGTRSCEPQEFADGDSVGVICGPVSATHSIVCVDLDSPDAIARADEHLPATGMCDGRASKPRCHRFYKVRHENIPAECVSKAEQAAPAAVERYGHAGPKIRHFSANGKPAFDLIGTGGQVVVSPSRHKSGECQRWDGDALGIPAEVDYVALMDAVHKLAAAIGCVVNVAKPKAAFAPKPKHGAEQKYEAALQKAVREDGLPRTGHGGDARTYRLLAYGANDFGLDDDAVLSVFCRIVNDPLKAVNDAWGEADLRRKLGIARESGHTPHQHVPPMRWDDAKRLAESFPDATHIVFRGKDAHRYDGKRYTELPGVDVENAMRRHAEASALKHYHDANKSYDEQIEAADKLIASLEKERDAGKNVRDVLNTAKAKRKGIKAPPRVVEPVSMQCVTNAVGSLRAARTLPPNTPFNVALSCITCPPRNWIACANGILDLSTFTLLPHTVDWFSPVLVPVRYDPTAIAPKFADMLHKVSCGDVGIAAVLQEVVGACLDPWCRVQHFSLLVGEGANGKSTFLTVLRALLGTENVSGVDLSAISRSNFMAYQLLGKLANISGDAAYFESEDTSKLKRLTGGDVFEFEAKNKQPIAAVNTAKLIAGCNELPRLRDKSEGVWRRAVLVPFNWRVPAGEQNPAVLDPQYWQDELPGVLNWAIEGLKRLRARGEFALPDACKALLREHRLDSNPTRRFLEEWYAATDDEAAYVVAADMFTAYRLWSHDNGIKHEIASNSFGKEVRRVFAGARDGWKKINGVAKRAWFGVQRVTAGTEGHGTAVTAKHPELKLFPDTVTAVTVPSLIEG